MTTPAAIKVLILGDPGGLGKALAQRLRELGAESATAVGGNDAALAERLAEPGWTALAVLTHDDALALRLTLLSAHVRPDLPLWVSLFDRTIVHQVRHVVPSVNVVPTAELVAQELADHCEAMGARPTSRFGGGVRIVDDALRLMVIAGAGLLITLVIQTGITIAALHDNLIDALYFSTRTVATVADVPRSGFAPDWFKLISTLTTVIALVLVAIFTAALVRRLSRSRLTTLFGPRRVPARGHVLLVGFGQIGFRLAQELKKRGVPVAALERDFDAPCVRLARRAGIPVAIGRGDDRAMLELLGVRRCAVVTAVTSDDLANVSIGLAASDVRPGVPLVLRLGDGNVAAETESLLHLGQICDAHGLIAQTLAQAVIDGGRPATSPASV
jgi:NAD(P)-dependent dehydrogenase (short-subunit alcohol dehydrogenase family)